MDLPLWEPWPSDECDTSSQTGHSNGDNQMGNYSFGFGRDAIEEDILNEKSCVQVLNIWINKADDEIKKLQEDIMMLKCQLLWDDKNWSRTCSTVLVEKICRLDILVHSLKNGITTAYSHLAFQTEHPENLAERLCDLLKPLLENHILGKTMTLSQKHTKSSTSGALILPANEIGEKKLESCNSGHEATAKPLELEKMESNDTQQACIQIVDSTSEESTIQVLKIHKASTHKRRVNKNVALTKPKAKRSRKTSKIAEITESREALGTDTNTLNNNHDKTVSTLKPESKGPLKKYKRRGKNIAQQTKTDGALQAEVNSIPLPRKKRKKSSTRLPKTSINKTMKLSPMDDNNQPPDGMPEEFYAHKYSLPTGKNEETLKLKDLRIIAKNQKLPGYYKLQKRELQERLRLKGHMSLQ